MPGAGHGGGGSLKEVDWASAIMGWVENDDAPTQMTYSFTNAGTARSMPACQYPKYPKYNGSGDVNVAASYTCS
ncbi:Mono(2-hydroxyethyl) terephthalate hydrolase [compost metagenome]